LSGIQVGRRANEEELEPLRFKVKGRVAHLLGAESVSDRFVAINELIKNSYDADATKVKVKFENVRSGSPSISIIDDGHGMGIYELQTEWMVVGTDKKLRDTYSKEHHRRKIGRKGIGRFAIQNLARMVEVISRPKNETKAYRIVFDWDTYNQPSSMMESVVNPTFAFAKRKEDRGFEIRFSDLRDRWTEDDIKRLSRNLGVIIPPNVSGAKFNVIIEAPEFPNYSGKLRSSLLDQAIFTFKAKLHENGKIRYVLESRKRERQSYDDSFKDFSCGPIDFILFFFYRDKEHLGEYGVKTTDIEGFRESINQFAGVKLYRDGLRVTGIGDPGDDWLQLDAMRVNSPATIPSTNQLIGIVRITSDQNPGIVDTTTREGIIKNKAFEDLRDFVKVSVKFFADHRAELEGKNRKHKKRKAGEIKKAMKNLSTQQELPPFLDFRPKYPEVFYKPLEEEINNAFNRSLPNATLMLTRKLVENLLYNVLERKFPARPPIWYDIKRARANDFGLLVDNLKGNRNKFAPDEQELVDKLLSLIKPFKREANSKAHKVIQYLDSVDDLKSLKVQEIVELEIKLIEKVRGLTPAIATH